MKVKEFKNWTKLIFVGRTILKDDLKYMSFEQKNYIGELEVVRSENRERTLYIEER